MNIQIYASKKNFDTQKAERYFKERRIKYQYIDISRYPMSRGEFSSVRSSVGLDALMDKDSKEYPLLKYLAYDDDKAQKIMEDPGLLKTPVVRNGKKATVGYCPEVWKEWE